MEWKTESIALVLSCWFCIAYASSFLQFLSYTVIGTLASQKFRSCGSCDRMTKFLYNNTTLKYIQMRNGKPCVV